MPLLAVTPRRPLHWVDLICEFCINSLIAQSIEVFRFPRRLRPQCLSLSQRTIYSVSFVQAFLALLPEIFATLGYRRLCSHPLERLVMIVASLFRICHPLGFLPLMSTICLFEYCPFRMLQFPILACIFDHDSLPQYFIQTVQLLVMISSAWLNLTSPSQGSNTSEDIP